MLEDRRGLEISALYYCPPIHACCYSADFIILPAIWNKESEFTFTMAPNLWSRKDNGNGEKPCSCQHVKNVNFICFTRVGQPALEPPFPMPPADPESVHESIEGRGTRKRGPRNKYIWEKQAHQVVTNSLSLSLSLCLSLSLSLFFFFFFFFLSFCSFFYAFGLCVCSVRFYSCFSAYITTPFSPYGPCGNKCMQTWPRSSSAFWALLERTASGTRSL